MKKFFDLQMFAKVVKLTNKADYYENETSNVKILALGGDDTIKIILSANLNLIPPKKFLKKI